MEQNGEAEKDVACKNLSSNANAFSIDSIIAKSKKKQVKKEYQNDLSGK